MATTEVKREKSGTSLVVKVTGMSEELLRLLDARVRQQQATGRAEYIRELIRRDVLAPQDHKPKRHKARRRGGATSEQSLLAEYHTLADAELARALSSAEAARLREVEAALDRAEAQSPDARLMAARLEETAGKLGALLAAVQALPKAKA